MGQPIKRPLLCGRHSHALTTFTRLCICCSLYRDYVLSGSRQVYHVTKTKLKLHSGISRKPGESYQTFSSHWAPTPSRTENGWLARLKLDHKDSSLICQCSMDKNLYTILIIRTIVRSPLMKASSINIAHLPHLHLLIHKISLSKLQSNLNLQCG